MKVERRHHTKLASRPNRHDKLAPFTLGLRKLDSRLHISPLTVDFKFSRKQTVPNLLVFTVVCAGGNITRGAWQFAATTLCLIDEQLFSEGYHFFLCSLPNRLSLWFLVISNFVLRIAHILSSQVAVENQVRTLRHRWEMVKRGDLLGFLASANGVEMPPQLESSVSEMTRSLKSLFSVLFCTSRGEPSISQQLLATISHIKEMLQTRLTDYEDYLLVKGQRNVTMTAYPFHRVQSFLSA